MAVFGSPLVIVMLVLGCCWNLSSIADCAQYSHAQSPTVVFAFGDAFTDTGNGVRTFNPVLFPAAFQPYGRTYFGEGAGRFSDGRSLIDCIVQSLGLPFLNPFFNFVGTDFSNGASYAVGGSTALDYSTVLELGYSSDTQYTLSDQLQWHLSFLKFAEAGRPGVTRFPTMPAIEQALYFIMIGGEDVGQLFLTGLSTESLRNTTLRVVAKVTEAIQLLYNHGARNFLLTSQYPMGCSPYAKYSSTDDVDERGCISSLNDRMLEYSAAVAAISESLSKTLPNASAAFLDIYSAVDEMFTYPDRYGIVDTLNVCCAPMNIPEAALVNGYISSVACGPMSLLCDDPNTYLNWEGYHYTDNTLRQIVNMFVEGKYITPSDALARFGAAQLSKALRPGRHVRLSHSSVVR